MSRPSWFVLARGSHSPQRPTGWHAGIPTWIGFSRHANASGRCRVAEEGASVSAQQPTRLLVHHIGEWLACPYDRRRTSQVDPATARRIRQNRAVRQPQHQAIQSAQPAQPDKRWCHSAVNSRRCSAVSATGEWSTGHPRPHHRSHPQRLDWQARRSQSASNRSPTCRCKESSGPGGAD